MSPNRVVVTRSQRLGFVGLAVADLVGAVVLLNLGGGPGIADAPAGGDGERLPDTKFEVFGGGSAGFADYQGKPIVINFWASWRPACVAELAEFKKVHKELGDEATFKRFEKPTPSSSQNDDSRTPLLDQTRSPAN